MKAAPYRMGEYKIIEDDNGALWWEAHAGIGALVGGKCFIRGEILFIGPRESEEPGFLAKEFLNKLEQFPKWGKTKHYCLNYTIHECKSGRKLTNEETASWSRSQIQWTGDTGPSKTPFGEADQELGSVPPREVSYRLGRHEILQKPGGQTWYKTHSGQAGLRVGKCIIAGDILFIGTVETEDPGYSRQQFMDHLDQLPEWKTTPYYCPSCALYDCGTGESLSEAERGRAPNTVSGLKSDGVSGKHVKIQESVSLALSKVRAFLRATHSHSGNNAGPKERSIAEQKIKPKDGVRNKRSPEANAGVLSPSSLDAAIQRLGRKKWIGYFAVFFLIAGFLFLAVLVGHWKKEEGHHTRNGHPPSHRSDH